MSVIVFSKRTGKYLQRHSGSFNRAVNMAPYRSKSRDLIRKKFGSCPSHVEDYEMYRKYWRDVNQFAEDIIFNAKPEDARVYATESSATTSVGRFIRGRVSKRVYILPDHLEIHEIKESFVCVMRPDGSSNCDDEDAK